MSSGKTLQAFIGLGMKMQADVDAILAKAERLEPVPIDVHAAPPAPALKFFDVRLQLTEQQADALLRQLVEWRRGCVS